MNFEPKNVFIGLMDFFSILLPGAVLTYFLGNDLQKNVLTGSQSQFTEIEGWALFLFSSYLLGHFVFLLGSKLDDLYDYIRKGVDAAQIERLAKGEKLNGRLARWAAAWIFAKEQNRALNLAVKIKEYYLAPLLGKQAINTFQWCKARLVLDSPDAAASVQRFEADSKFFRSLLVVLIILLPLEARNWPLSTEIVVLLMILGSFYRYADQRLKSTNQVYWYIITQESRKPDGFRQAPPDGMEEITHAGGVVYRHKNDMLEYLVVQAKRQPDVWVLPKGHIEPGENMRETAVREVREETGVWSRIVDGLACSAYSLKNETVQVQFYLMEKLENGKPADRNRKSLWLPYEMAMQKLAHQESRVILSQADQRIKTSPLLSQGQLTTK